MSLETPEYLWLLLLLPFIILLFVYEYFHTRKALISLGGRWEDNALQSAVFLKTTLSSFVFCLFYLSAILGLCGISWGEKPVEEDRKGLDIVFSVDVSLSMLAQDMGTYSRMERAREFVRSTSQDFPDSRLALVVFRGASMVMVPLTEDHRAIENALPYLGPSVMTNPGTSLLSGLKTARQAFTPGGNHHRIIVFVSDGENLGASWESESREIRRSGALLLVLGVGSRQGANIILNDGTLVKNSQGQVVLSKKNTEALQALADAAGGIYLDGNSAGIYARISQEMKAWQARNEREGFRLEPIRRDSVFLLLALFFLVAHVILKYTRWRKIW